MYRTYHVLAEAVVAHVAAVGTEKPLGFFIERQRFSLVECDSCAQCDQAINKEWQESNFHDQDYLDVEPMIAIIERIVPALQTATGDPRARDRRGWPVG